MARVSGLGVGGQDHRCPGSAGFAEQRVQLLGTCQGLVKALEERTDDVMAWTVSPKIRIQAHPMLLHSALLGFTDQHGGKTLRQQKGGRLAEAS